MDFDPQRRVAAGLPGATEDIKWGADLVYSIGGKMFCVFCVIPAPYLARAKWVLVQPEHRLGGAALDDLIRRSHALVLGKLGKKLQRELNA